ncbi:MAG TPA: hypothetical protein VFL91_24580, partial [Thermomicrobiales bacterium]|nr:hypothetical protein [Thermomicrobiales bacterium]
MCLGRAAAPGTRGPATSRPPCQGRDSGSDGDYSRTYNTYRLSPDTHFAVDEPAVDAPPRRRSRLAPARWPEVAARAERESLRALARAYGVSPAAIRRALVAAGRADLLRDLARRRRLAAAAPA